jgi:hypothetical protein
LVPAFESEAANILDIAYVRVVLERTADSSVALDTTVQVQPSDSVIDLNLSVLLNADVETFWVTLECYTAADQLVFVGGPLEVTATAEDQAEPSAVNVGIAYVGVGSNAAAVRILSQEVTVPMGGTVTLAADALDSSGAVIGDTPIRWTSLDAMRAMVPDPETGLVVAGGERGVVGVEALLLTGQADTAFVLVEPVPTAIDLVSGDNQFGTVGTALPQTLVVRVTALDELGVAGVAVDFSTGDGGSFGQTPAVTDINGQASATWTLGLSEGAQTATATLSGFGNPQVTFSATAEPGQTATGNVLVLSNYNLPNAFIVDSFPQYMPGFTFDTMDVSVQTPTISYMIQYNVVLLYEDGTFPNAVSVGDAVAAYVELGGNVVIGTFYWQDRSDNPQYVQPGWGALEAIDPFTAPYGSEYRADVLDVTSIVAHPLTQGVNSLVVLDGSPGGFHGGVDAKPGTTVVARWSDSCTGCDTAVNTPLVGYRIESGGQRIVGVTVYPAYDFYTLTRGEQYRGDLYQLYENAFGWAAAGSQPFLPAGSEVSRLIRSYPAAVGARVGAGGGSGGRSPGNR